MCLCIRRDLEGCLPKFSSDHLRGEVINILAKFIIMAIREVQW